jgi:ADP-heptose:LPS heptosyltransferase
MPRPFSRASLFRLAGRFVGWPAAARPIRRLVVVKPDHFGDVLLASPALHTLRRHFPRTQITLAVGPRGEAVGHRLPDVDAVVVVPFPGLDPATQPGIASRWALLVRTARNWRGRFDAGLLMRDDYYWGALLLAAAGVPRRLGTATPLCAPFLTQSVCPPPGCSAAAQHQRLAALLTGEPAGPDHWTPDHPLRFQPGNGAGEAAQWRQGAGLAPDEPFVLLHPGAGAPVKLWTAEAWAAVVRALHDQLGLRTVVLAGADERHLIGPILRHAGEAAVGSTTALGLDGLAALMGDARLVLGVDSGPLHLAAALDVPSVRLYGPIDPVVYGPWGPPGRHRWVASNLLCAPCHRLHWDPLALPWHPCVRRIAPGDVLTAALAALAEPRAASRERSP